MIGRIIERPRETYLLELDAETVENIGKAFRAARDFYEAHVANSHSDASLSLMFDNLNLSWERMLDG